MIDSFCALCLCLNISLQVSVRNYRCLSALSIGSYNSSLTLAVTVSNLRWAHLCLWNNQLWLLDFVNETWLKIDAHSFSSIRLVIYLCYLLTAKWHPMLIVCGGVTSVRIPIILSIVNLKCAWMWSQYGLARTHLDVIGIVGALICITWFHCKFLHKSIHIHF